MASSMLKDAFDRILNLGHGSRYFLTKCGAFPIYKSNKTETGTNVSLKFGDKCSVKIYDEDTVSIYECDSQELHLVSAIITWIVHPEQAIDIVIQ